VIAVKTALIETPSRPRNFARGVSVAQLGARMDYAVPRILESSGLLQRLYTDGIYPSALRRMPDIMQPKLFKRLMRREPRGIDPCRITSFPMFGIQYAWRQRRVQQHQRVGAYLWAGREFCHKAIRAGIANAEMVYAFNSAALELMDAAHKNGSLCVLEQTIAPKRIERAILQEESARWPGWEDGPGSSNELDSEYGDREAEEWSKSDLIVCGSEFVAQSISDAGGPKERCVVIPYGVDPVSAAYIERSPSRDLHVLFVGRIGLRKGAPYIAECARTLKSPSFQFRVAGPSDLSPKALSEFASHVEVLGPVSKAEVADLYGWADVLILPTLCEGSATVCYEALAAGVPVITTPNAGSIVRDGIDGFIVPIRRADLLVEKLEMLAQDPDLLRSLSRNAAKRAFDYTLPRYSERLLAALTNLSASI
jgi:glycosyltransferase involved in cell wall biosynthesis